MPVIKITETEKTSYSQFDATDNTVLIPMLYCRKYEVEKDSEGQVIRIDYKEEENINGIEYLTAEEFAEGVKDSSGNYLKPAMKNKCAYVDGSYDRTYVMAYELLLQGLKVIIKPLTFANGDSSKYTLKGDYQVDINEAMAFDLVEENLTSNEKAVLKEFESKNIYNLTFITSGAYPNAGLVSEERSSIYKKLRDLAASRGDCVYLRELSSELNTNSKIIEEIKLLDNAVEDKFGACYIGWGEYSTTATGKIKAFKMPGCFGYLMAFAQSIRNNANWFAAAGVVRGKVPNLIKPLFEVTEALMHNLQGDVDRAEELGCYSNCLYNAGSYGYKIWGNKTIYQESTVTDAKYQDFLNVRILLCDIKKQIYHTSMRLTFEPNDEIVWLNFKSLNNTVLDQMKVGRGIDWYKWTKEKSDKKATIKATLTVKPIEAVDSFDININLTEEEADITE